MNPIFMQNMQGVQSFNEEQKNIKANIKTAGIKTKQDSIKIGRAHV